MAPIPQPHAELTVKHLILITVAVVVALSIAGSFLERDEPAPQPTIGRRVRTTGTVESVGGLHGLASVLRVTSSDGVAVKCHAEAAATYRPGARVMVAGEVISETSIGVTLRPCAVVRID